MKNCEARIYNYLKDEGFPLFVVAVSGNSLELGSFYYRGVCEITSWDFRHTDKNRAVFKSEIIIEAGFKYLEYETGAPLQPLHVDSPLALLQTASNFEDIQNKLIPRIRCEELQKKIQSLNPLNLELKKVAGSG